MDADRVSNVKRVIAKAWANGNAKWAKTHGHTKDGNQLDDDDDIGWNPTRTQLTKATIAEAIEEFFGDNFDQRWFEYGRSGLSY